MNFAMCDWTHIEVRSFMATFSYMRTAGVPTPAHTLGLDANALTDAALPPLIDGLLTGAMPQLRVLHLDRNELSDAGLDMLSPLLSGPLSGRLEGFSYGANLTDEGVRTLVGLVEDGHLTALKRLDVPDNGIADVGATALADVLVTGGLPALVSLDLTRNQIGDAGAIALADALAAGRLATLTYMSLHHNRIGNA